MNVRLIRYRDGRQAIEHGAVRLAVPTTAAGTPRAVRRTVYELVLRRQIGLAAMVAGGYLETPTSETFRDSEEELAVLIADRPNSSHLNEVA